MGVDMRERDGQGSVDEVERNWTWEESTMPDFTTCGRSNGSAARGLVRVIKWLESGKERRSEC